MFFTIYKTSTGEIVMSGVCQQSEFQNQKVDIGCAIIEAESNPATHYVQGGQVIEMPQRPDTESYFDYQTKQWVADTVNQSIKVKEERNRLLYESDWTQIPNNPLTTEKQAEWALYRQYLRDISNQSGYPFNVVWPTKPE